MRTWALTRPLAAVLLIEVGALTVVLLGTPLLAATFGNIPGYSVRHISQSFILVLVLTAALLVLLKGFNWWQLAGFTRVRDWRDLKLFWFPVVLLAVPLLGGVDGFSGKTLLLLSVAYLATGVYEEGMWRGVQLGLLARTGVWRAVLITSLLFGAAHLANSALRGFSAIILAQAFGAGVQGIGWAALRLRTNTIWPLIAIHALSDLFLQMGTLPIAMIEPPIDTVTAVYGVYLLRRSMRDRVIVPPDDAVLGLPEGEPAQRVTTPVQS